MPIKFYRIVNRRNLHSNIRRKTGAFPWPRPDDNRRKETGPVRRRARAVETGLAQVDVANERGGRPSCLGSGAHSCSVAPAIRPLGGSLRWRHPRRPVAKNEIARAPRRNRRRPIVHDQGRTTESHDLLTSVYGWFTEGFDTADLKEAKSLLEELF